MIKLKEKTAIEPEADESSARTTYYKELFTRLAAMAATTIDKSALELLRKPAKPSKFGNPADAFSGYIQKDMDNAVDPAIKEDAFGTET